MTRQTASMVRWERGFAKTIAGHQLAAACKKAEGKAGENCANCGKPLMTIGGRYVPAKIVHGAA